MTRKERHQEVVASAERLGLIATADGTNDWTIADSTGHRGLLSYNQRSGVWKSIGLSRAHFGSLAGLLSLFAAPAAVAPRTADQTTENAE